MAPCIGIRKHLFSIGTYPASVCLAVAFVLCGAVVFGDQPRNVILLLSDDHRYDFMRFHPDSPKFLETPNFDRMAREGVHLANTFVTTSLCSPSRASILTGKFMHAHRVVDNQRPVPADTVFSPVFAAVELPDQLYREVAHGARQR